MDTVAIGWYPLELKLQARRLSIHCQKFCEPNNRRALGQLAVTLILFAGSMVAMITTATFAYWLTLIIAIPAAGLLVRLFAIQHDCGHSSFFSNRQANERVGLILSVLTFTPFDHWRRSHALHHAGSGNLDRRGIGDVETKTVAEFQSMTSVQKWRYRLYRHPFIALFIGPPVLFLILQRAAIGSELPLRNSWKEHVFHNALLVGFYGSLAWILGPLLLISVVLPVVLMGSWIGGFLFFVQHQFEETLWEGADEWDVKIAALKGSSHLVLPSILNWFTCHIGLHHIHHLCSRIPNYRLAECMAADPELETVAPRLNLWQAIKGVRYSLWDERSRRLITFKDFEREFST